MSMRCVDRMALQGHVLPDGNRPHPRSNQIGFLKADVQRPGFIVTVAPAPVRTWT